MSGTGGYLEQPVYIGSSAEGGEALSDIGLFRTFCQDAPDPSNQKHKVMRYEAIIDMESESTYWPK